MCVGGGGGGGERCLLAYQVVDAVGDSGLCCVRVASFEH